MFNFKHSAETVKYTVAEAYTAGTPLKIADGLIGVCHVNLAAGETGAFRVTGVYSAVADGAIAIGSQLYLIGDKVGSASSAGMEVGKAFSDAVDGGIVEVALNQ